MQDLPSRYPVAVAALLLLARKFRALLGLPAPAVTEVPKTTNVSMSAA